MVASSRKLRHYFQSHQVTVVTDQPLKEIFTNKEFSGRITKWTVELVEYDPIYKRSTAIKSQVLVDFIAEWTPTKKSAIPEDQEYWTLFTDREWGMHGAGASTVLISPTDSKLTYVVRFNFSSTNNIVEYEGVMLGLRKAKALGTQKMMIKTDLQVVVGQVQEDFMVWQPELIKYVALVRSYEKIFRGFSITDIPRSENEDADILAKAAA